jgi:hypothetical protein
LIAAVAVAAFVSLVAANADRHEGITDKRALIAVASAVAAIFGLAAVRRPRLCLWLLIAVWIATPIVDHPRPDVINVSTGSCFLGWIIGAPVGWVSRGLTKARKSFPVAPKPLEPEE